MGSVPERQPAPQEAAGTGEILQDGTSLGRPRPWREKRLGTERVAAAYSALGQEGKAARCRECGSVLVFAECPVDGRKHLKAANFCRERLCPMCAWRRSLKWAADVSRVLHLAVEQHTEWAYVMLSLTQRNVPGEALAAEVTRILRGWTSLTRREEFRAIAGWFRTLEVTRNPRTGEWHPHIHALLAVEPDYWHKRYVSHARWVSAWRDVLGLDYDPSVEVHRAKSRRNGDTLDAVAREVAKYAVKDSDLVGGEPEAAVVERVRVLDGALAGRRLVGWGGELRRLARAVRVAAEGREDLVHVSGEHDPSVCPVCGSEMLEHVYRWVHAIRQYVG